MRSPIAFWPWIKSLPKVPNLVHPSCFSCKLVVGQSLAPSLRHTLMSCSLLTITSGAPTLPLGHRDLPWQWALLPPGGREGTLAASTGAMSDLGWSCIGYGGQSCHPALPSLQSYQVYLSWKGQSGWRLPRILGCVQSPEACRGSGGELGQPGICWQLRVCKGRCREGQLL